MTMLDELLKQVRAGGTHRVGDLARLLDTTPAMVEMMVEDLARMGYLKSVNGGECGEKCSSCSVFGQCIVGRKGRIFGLVENQKL